jgi:hypothetical protein
MLLKIAATATPILYLFANQAICHIFASTRMALDSHEPSGKPATAFTLDLTEHFFMRAFTGIHASTAALAASFRWGAVVRDFKEHVFLMAEGRWSVALAGKNSTPRRQATSRK